MLEPKRSAPDDDDGEQATLDLLASGELEVEGRLVDASNATLYCTIRPPGEGPGSPPRGGPGGFGGTGSPPKSRGGLGGIVPPRVTEPLSDSEIRVLRYLPTNLSAREIADELVLSWYTVKTHMRHLYAKLGTHTRHETVERARALGLLAPSPRRLAS